MGFGEPFGREACPVNERQVTPGDTRIDRLQIRPAIAARPSERRRDPSGIRRLDVRSSVAPILSGATGDPKSGHTASLADSGAHVG